MCQGLVRACLVLNMGLLLPACRSAKETLTIHTLSNYSQQASQQILFLDFAISRSAANRSERITLTNSILGQGELKNIARPVHNPYQIKLVRYFSDGRQPERDSLEHPLFKSVEIAESNGALSRRLISETNGHFSVRFPYLKALNRIDVYSSTPDNGLFKIHTLRLKL